MKERPGDKAERLAGNRWESVFNRLAPELGDAMKAKPKQHVCCPVHGTSGPEDGFRLFEDWTVTGGGICNTCGAKKTGVSLYAWLKDIEYGQAIKDILDLLEGSAISARPVHVKTAKEIRQEEAKRAEADRKAVRNIRRLWQQAIPLDDRRAEVARLYFARRKLRLFKDASVVRFHPSVVYFDAEAKEVTGRFPALLFKICDSAGRPVTIHRIYLDSEGRKAPVPIPKKTMTYPEGVRTLSGGAIRLAPAAPILGVAEGPETALAVMEATGMPVWATTSATLLRGLVVPSVVRQVAVWYDKDVSETGYKACNALCKRLWESGVRCGGYAPTLAIPSGHKSVDWWDVWNVLGASTFPNVDVVNHPARSGLR